MKKTATLMASLLVLAMASPLAACGSKSAAEVYTEVQNAVNNFSVPQSHAVFYEQELYRETATSIERRYTSEQDNVSKEENLFSSLNTYKTYTATKNSAGEITSEQEWESQDYSTVRQFGGAYMDYAGRGYKTVSKPGYANEWIIYDATSPKEGNKMSGDSYDMHGLEIMIYESIRENTNVYSCIECFFHFSL